MGLVVLGWSEGQAQGPQPPSQDIIQRAIEFAGPVWFQAKDIKDLVGLVARLRDKQDPLSQYLWTQFSQATRQLLEEYDGSRVSSEALRRALVREFNRQLLDPSLFEKQRFAQIELPKSVRKQITHKQKGKSLIYLNRLLLEAAYPDALAKSQPLAFRGKKKIGWQECYIFIRDGERIYVDTITGQVTAAFYPFPLMPPEGRKIDVDTAKVHIQKWLSKRGVSWTEWILAEQKVYDRGSAGREYVFTWIKRSPQGIRLPCLMKIAIGEEGRVHSFRRIERDLEVSLIPSIEANEAMEIAGKAVGWIQPKIERQELRVWFDEEGKQQLWWELRLRKDGNQRTVILNAHTGKVITILQPLGDPAKPWGETVKKKEIGIWADFRSTVKVEILACQDGTIWGGPLGVPTRSVGAQVVGVIENKETLRLLLEEMHRMLQRGRLEGALGTTPLWLRFHLRGGQWIYHCKFGPKANYFEVCTKEPWPQALESDDWPPEGSVRIGLSCQPTRRFQEIIINSLDPDIQTAFPLASPSPSSRGWLWGLIGGIGAGMIVLVLMLRRRQVSRVRSRSEASRGEHPGKSDNSEP
jgi:hypothetical protein